ncbi:unnamed protein product [Ilex paraguariensis]|uniref:DNA-directed DNA polymerase family A palm domain-containing protein n=1 Tax=Ilex paraguariensis TaxID=185542 RepID=A0ABC8RZ80_9AQUA
MEAMAMGFSNHTSPFKPSYCPPHVWLCHLCHRASSMSPSSRSFWASSRKALHRREICPLDNANGPFSRAAVFSSYFKCKQSSSYYTQPHTDNQKYENSEHGDWKLEVCRVQKENHFTSSARMRQNLVNRVSSKGKHFPNGFGNVQSLKEEIQVPKDFMRPGNLNTAIEWHRESVKVKETRALYVSITDNNVGCVDGKSNDAYHRTSGETTESSAPVVKGLQDCSNYQKLPHCYAFLEEKYSLEDVINEDVASPVMPSAEAGVNDNDAPNNICNGGSFLSTKNFAGNAVESIAENGAFRSSIGSKQMGFDTIKPQSSGLSYKSNRQEQMVNVNGEKHHTYKKDCALHKPASMEQDPFEPMERDVANGKHASADIENEIQRFYQFRLRETLGRIYDKVLVVDNISTAKEIVSMLTNQYRHLVHACDTEVAKIDVKQETPVDHGEVICFSIYSGPEANFGNGKSCVWVDVLDGGGRSLLAEFAPFFEDSSIRKVWHNYSFDNHVIENYGLKVSGFHADTMHMARLWDSSRRTDGGYSLEALTGDRSVMSDARLCPNEGLVGKVSMKTIFGRRKVKKDGSEGKIVTVPPVEELQRVERKSWVCYSSLDSISTLQLYESLKKKLTDREWNLDGMRKGTMFDFYEKYWHPFGNLLVKMETEGMLVDRAYLAEIEKVAKAEQQVAADRFRKWASNYCPDAKYMNVGSDTQLRQLFFGGSVNRKDPNVTLPMEKDFKIPNVDNVIEEGKKTPTKYRKIKLHRLGSDINTDMYTASGWPSVSGDALKALAGKVSAEFDSTEQLDDIVVDSHAALSDSTKGLDTSAYGTAYAAFGEGQQGIEACHAIAALCKVCSIDSLISNFILPLQGGHISGKNGRIHCSLNINTETGRLSARRPNLQNQPALEKDRYKIRKAFIAAPGNSLIVADYGQDAFTSERRKAKMLNFSIAYGKTTMGLARDWKVSVSEAKETVDLWYSDRQEVRKWQKKHKEKAHKYSCVHTLLGRVRSFPSMNNATPSQKGHIERAAINTPVQDAFTSERRKAKMLNFSIAYGKTTMGLARDWKVSVSEAKETVDLWYSDRQEVRKWQKKHKEKAHKYSCVHTLLGRVRSFPSMNNATPSQKGHIERAAINTPVQGSAADVAMCAMLEIEKNARLKELGWRLLLQGSAADVAMCAMLEIEKNARLKELGWRLLLQVHDEVILEGPTESAEVAKAIVVECMSKPFDGKNILRVDLSVDAKCAQNWYSAK